ncbi:MAG: hypothetical protein M1819_001857 [Sarea resinae]|nr:MAG: hypothetical protein M1819_001857 [Sarea resinae]
MTTPETAVWRNPLTTPGIEASYIPNGPKTRLMESRRAWGWSATNRSLTFFRECLGFENGIEWQEFNNRTRQKQREFGDLFTPRENPPAFCQMIEGFLEVYGERYWPESKQKKYFNGEAIVCPRDALNKDSQLWDILIRLFTYRVELKRCADSLKQGTATEVVTEEAIAKETTRKKTVAERIPIKRKSPDEEFSQDTMETTNQGSNGVRPRSRMVLRLASRDKLDLHSPAHNPNRPKDSSSKIQPRKPRLPLNGIESSADSSNGVGSTSGTVTVINLVDDDDDNTDQKPSILALQQQQQQQHNNDPTTKPAATTLKDEIVANTRLFVKSTHELSKGARRIRLKSCPTYDTFFTHIVQECGIQGALAAKTTHMTIKYPWHAVPSDILMTAGRVEDWNDFCEDIAGGYGAAQATSPNGYVYSSSSSSSSSSSPSPSPSSSTEPTKLTHPSSVCLALEVLIHAGNANTA